MPQIRIWWQILHKEGWKFMPGCSITPTVGLCWPQWPSILESIFSLRYLVKKARNCKTPNCFFLIDLIGFSIDFDTALLPHQILLHSGHFWTIYGTFQTFGENLKKIKTSVNGRKMIKMSPYLVDRLCSVELYRKSCQIHQKMVILWLFWHFQCFWLCLEKETSEVNICQLWITVIIQA